MIFGKSDWTVEQALAWLSEHPWGSGFIEQYSPDMEEIEKLSWLDLIATMHASFYMEPEPPAMMVLDDEEPDILDCWYMRETIYP